MQAKYDELSAIIGSHGDDYLSVEYKTLCLRALEKFIREEMERDEFRKGEALPIWKPVRYGNGGRKNVGRCIFIMLSVGIVGI